MKINSEKHKIGRTAFLKHVSYDPYTGHMRRILKYHPKSGKPYECDDLIQGTNNRGYLWFKIFGHMYLCHRVAFLIMTGKHPKNEIDHVNGNRIDNRWVNLRACDSFENSRNQGVRIDNTSGVRGVNYNTCSTIRSKKRWVARISHKGMRILIGNFSTFKEAVEARKNAEIEYGYHSNHGKRKSWSK